MNAAVDEIDGPRWEVRGDGPAREVRLLGRWSLVPLARAGQAFARELDALADRHTGPWDLEHVERLDSAGARLLWRAWGDRLPEELRCRDEQRHWFDRLEGLASTRRPRARPDAWLVALGRRLAELVNETAGVTLLGARLVSDAAYCVRRPRAIPWLELSATVYRCGAQSLALLAFIGVLVGVVLVYQLAPPLQQLNAETQVIGAVGMGFLRELGPFLAGLIVVARTGSAITAGIGGMRITEEIDALRALGVSPTLRVVLPRVVGLGVALPLLVVWTDFCGVLGAIYVSTERLGVGWRMWLAQFPDAVGIDNVFIGIGKSAFFGALIGLVASYYGLRAARSTQGLTANTTRSVVVGTALLISIDGLIGVLLSSIGV